MLVERTTRDLIFHWMKSYYALCTQFKVKQVKVLMDLFLTNTHTAFVAGLEWCGLTVDYYCDVYIICLDSHSDGTHSLHGSIGE